MDAVKTVLSAKKMNDENDLLPGAKSTSFNNWACCVSFHGLTPESSVPRSPDRVVVGRVSRRLTLVPGDGGLKVGRVCAGVAVATAIRLEVAVGYTTGGSQTGFPIPLHALNAGCRLVIIAGSKF